MDTCPCSTLYERSFLFFLYFPWYTNKNLWTLTLFIWREFVQCVPWRWSAHLCKICTQAIYLPAYLCKLLQSSLLLYLQCISNLKQNHSGPTGSSRKIYYRPCLVGQKSCPNSLFIVTLLFIFLQNMFSNKIYWSEIAWLHQLWQLNTTWGHVQRTVVYRKHASLFCRNPPPWQVERRPRRLVHLRAGLVLPGRTTTRSAVVQQRCGETTAAKIRGFLCRRRNPLPPSPASSCVSANLIAYLP